MHNEIGLEQLPDSGDQRGFSYTVPEAVLDLLPSTKDVHIAGIEPGGVRGNHCHWEREEIIVVVYGSTWLLAWDKGEGTAISRKGFSGRGAVAISVRRGQGHAIKNTGSESLTIIALSSGVFRADASETQRRELL